MVANGTPDRVVDAELDASGITIGDVGIQVNGADVSAANPVPTQQQTPVATGGLSTYRNIDLGTTGQVVKASATKVYDLFVYNNAATVRFFKTYNKATAATSADTPQATYPIPAGSGIVVCSAVGRAFTTGLSVRASTGVADNDNTAPSANDVIVVIGYI